MGGQGRPPPRTANQRNSCKQRTQHAVVVQRFRTENLLGTNQLYCAIRTTGQQISYPLALCALSNTHRHHRIAGAAIGTYLCPQQLRHKALRTIEQGTAHYREWTDIWKRFRLAHRATQRHRRALHLRPRKLPQRIVRWACFGRSGAEIGIYQPTSVCRPRCKTVPI